MPYELEKCPNCGATITASSASFAKCEYCNAILERVQATASSASVSASSDVASALGAPESSNRARRVSVAEMATRSWQDDQRLVWPERSTASSEYGVAWGAGNVVGPPRVFPLHGDVRGAWASRSHATAEEWLECHFPIEAPDVTGLLVFETFHPGGLYSITDETNGVSEVLWRQSPALEANEARVLEIQFARPRPLRVVRLHVDQRPIGSWSEIDSVALVANQPVPALHARAWASAAQRNAHAMTRVSPARSRGRAVIFGVGALVLLGALAARHGSGNARALPRIVESIGGSVASSQHPDVGALTSTARWGGGVDEFSTQYSPGRNSAAAASGVPDVYPSSGDLESAWAPRTTDGGFEWITVRYDTPIAARAVLIVETFHPGAVIRVDDMTDAGRPTALWSGVDPSSRGTSSVLRIDLASPRTISRIRVVLDTRRVPGWNEIDAVGLGT